MDTKTKWQSKTLWANFIGGAIAVATAFGFDVGLTTEMQAQLVTGIMIVVNAFLRFKTTKPIK
jgi:hypothetical protein